VAPEVTAFGCEEIAQSADEVQASMKEKGLASASLEIVKKLLDKAIRKRLEVD
jgi:hypothetical protein